MSEVSYHKSSSYLPGGILAKWLSVSDESTDGRQSLHSDDYYVFGYLESGECCVRVDFQEISLTAGNVLVVRPGQLHSFVSGHEAKGFVIMVDDAYISDLQRKLLGKYELYPSALPADSSTRELLSRLFGLLTERYWIDLELSDSFATHIGMAIVDVFCKLSENIYADQTPEGRYLRHCSMFRALLSEYVTENRRPSYYADKMNISEMYLNEAVKAVTGKSVSRNIIDEILLRAKRKLVFTDDSVSMIAAELGFQDSSYFSRLFAKTVGVSPTVFRKNHS